MCVHLHLYVCMGHACMYVLVAFVWYNTLHTLWLCLSSFGVCVWRFVCVSDAVFDGTPRSITTYIGAYVYVLVTEAWVYSRLYTPLHIPSQKILRLFLKLFQRTIILPIITVLWITWYSSFIPSFIPWANEHVHHMSKWTCSSHEQMNMFITSFIPWASRFTKH